MKIWIVEGTSGEYSDQDQWIVCAYRSKERAEDVAANATRRADEIQKNRKRYEPIPDGANEFDPKMRMGGYTGTEYYTVECELK